MVVAGITGVIVKYVFFEFVYLFCCVLRERLVAMTMS